MNIFKLIIALAIAAGAYHYWSKHHEGSESGPPKGSSQAHNGFVALPAVAGADTAAVLVIAAEDCPEEAAQRANRLAEQLTSNGIPVSRLHDVSFNIPNGDSSEAQRVMSVMNGELPIVIVRGKAKSNPSLGEVTAEYRASGH